MIKFLIFLMLNFFISFQCLANESYLIEQEINKNVEHLAKLNQEKHQIETKIEEQSIKIKEKKSVILKRIQSLAYLRKFQWGTLLARLDSPQQLDRNLRILKELNEYDLSLFKDYRIILKSLSDGKLELEKSTLRIKSQIEKLKNQQKQLAINEQKYLNEINKKNIPSLLKMKGQLTRPLDGETIWTFGSLMDKSNQYVFLSKGFLYKTQADTSIKSIGPGVIIFRDVLDHWRETLIMQHDDNYYSVYAGVKSDSSKLKKSVEAGEVIGSTLDDEFYFELRHFDSPINPKYWFKESM